MINLKDLSSAQLQRIINIKARIEGLEQELDSIGNSTGPRRKPGRPKARKMSSAGRKAIAEAAKKRWAAYRKEKPAKPVKVKRRFSAEVRAKLKAAAKARWAKARAEGKKRL